MKHTIFASALVLGAQLAATGSGPAPARVPVGQFAFPDDLELTVWATTPLFYNPTNMDTDREGRIYVAEGVNYRRNAGRRPEGDRIMVLQDTDGDGRADSSHCFVQEEALMSPLGVSVFDNKVVVAQPPSLLVYTDVDRDLKFDPTVDTREELLTGFNARNHDHGLHAATAGPDGKWYFNQGNCGALVTDREGNTFRLGGSYYNSGAGTPHWFNNPLEYSGKPSDDGRVWISGAIGRMNPDGTAVQIVGHGFRNSYEHCHSSFGDLFQNDNDDPPACRTTWLMEGAFLGYFSRDGKRSWLSDRRPGQDVPTAHWRQDDPGVLPAGDVYGTGSPTGVAFYENGALPEKYAGTLFSCEARKRVIFSYSPRLGDGAALEIGPRSDFVESRENVRFRPSDVMVGADGALYFADWFDSTVGAHQDFDASRSGTIYRLAPKGFRPEVPSRVEDPVEDAIALLRSPAAHVRFSGFTALKSIGDAALPAVEALLGDPDRWVAARAVWLLPSLGEEGVEACRKRLAHQDPEQRILAFRALRNAGGDVLELGSSLASDPSPAVRRELAVALRALGGPEKRDLVLRLFAGFTDVADRTYLEACGLAAETDEAEVWEALSQAHPEPLSWSPQFARVTWRLLPEAAVPALVARAEAASLTAAERRLAFDTLAFIGNKEAVSAIAEIAKSDDAALVEQAEWWLISHGLDKWAKYGGKALLKETGIYDAETAVLNEVIAPDPPQKSALPAPAEVAKLAGDAARGKVQASRCIMCHEIEGVGIAFGPDLSGWVRDQGREAFYLALIEPSAGIAHDYEATRLQLKNGVKIDGILRTRGDPIQIESAGGVKQLVPRDSLEKVVRRRKNSLMLSADQLGLTPQDMADIAAYLEAL